jgi:copper homeostasis protein
MSGLPRHSVLLEVCIASVDDALNAEAGGAGRLELNAALALGGLTPSLGTFLEVKKAVSLPVFVMIRPRPGGFCYSDADLAVMRRDVDLFVEHGADGIVFGVLHEDGTVDEARCRQILHQIGALSAVFHRAFDMTPEPFVSLEQLIGLGFKRVMTSGQQETAYNGAALIAELIRLAAGRIEVLPASGINRLTVADVVSRTGCDQVHASLRHSVSDRSTSLRPNISLAGSAKPAKDAFDATSLAAIIELCNLLKGLPH